jgi:hypothetical protein
MKIHITIFHIIMLSSLIGLSCPTYSMTPEKPVEMQQQSSLLFKALTNFKLTGLGTIGAITFIHGAVTLAKGLIGPIPNKFIIPYFSKSPGDDDTEVIFHRLGSGTTALYVSYLAFKSFRESWRKILREHYLHESLPTAKTR